MSMNSGAHEDLLDRAENILKTNDLGAYTVPTHGLYPFQWNWDSCLTALGLSHFDENRAWTEIETLFSHQWDDGMVPHIVFHKADDGYFPGPEVWSTNRPTPTSGITQPPVAGYILRRLFERAGNRDTARSRAEALLPKVTEWHEWFFRCRDPEGTGLVAILHPWESGRDNSVDWDDALARVPNSGISPFVRRDTKHADPDHRPTQDQYRRFIWLVERFRKLDWDNGRLHDASPFCMVDPGFNSILVRSCEDLANLAETLGQEKIARRNRAQAKKGLAALETLWEESLGQYVCLDRKIGKHVVTASIGGLLPIFASIPPHRAAAIARRIERIGETVRYLVPSHNPDDSRFDAQRYWRGPVWLVVNHMIIDGLEQGDFRTLAGRIAQDSLALARSSGFAEYYSPLNSAPCGGAGFSWTAAMVTELLHRPEFVP